MLDEAPPWVATSVAPKYLAPIDLAARWTKANDGLAFFAYATNYLIDLDHAVIVEVETSSAVPFEVGKAHFDLLALSPRGWILKLDRLRLRGPCGARDEFILAAIAQNLRKLAKLIPAPAPILAT